MPDAHRRYAEWTPSRVIRWAETIGPETALTVRQVLESRPHPEQGFRSCLGIIHTSLTGMRPPASRGRASVPGGSARRATGASSRS
jgi:hypothetical protein